MIDVMNPRVFEPCPMAKWDCASRSKNGLCVALKDIDYGPGKPCPFYKTAEQKAEDERNALEWLMRLGRMDLLAKYHGGELHEPV